MDIMDMEKVNSFVTPKGEKPELANGPYLSFTGDNGVVTYIQMTNGRILWIKQVSADGKSFNVTAFDEGCTKYVTDYFAQRVKDTEK